MNIKIKDVLSLDDKKEYLVASKINYENKQYYYLVDLNDNTNLKFCVEDNNELVELENKELITTLLPLFLNEAMKELETE